MDAIIVRPAAESELSMLTSSFDVCEAHIKSRSVRVASPLKGGTVEAEAFKILLPLQPLSN